MKLNFKLLFLMMICLISQNTIIYCSQDDADALQRFSEVQRIRARRCRIALDACKIGLMVGLVTAVAVYCLVNNKASSDNNPAFNSTSTIANSVAHPKARIHRLLTPLASNNFAFKNKKKVSITKSSQKERSVYRQFQPQPRGFNNRGKKK